MGYDHISTPWEKVPKSEKLKKAMESSTFFLVENISSNGPFFHWNVSLLGGTIMIPLILLKAFFLSWGHYSGGWRAKDYPTEMFNQWIQVNHHVTHIMHVRLTYIHHDWQLTIYIIKGWYGLEKRLVFFVKPHYLWYNFLNISSFPCNLWVNFGALPVNFSVDVFFWRCPVESIARSKHEKTITT